MKHALVKPLIKTSSLDPSGYKNYRQVCNLGFVSKIIEKVVTDQLKSYLYANNLDDEVQPAYKKNHSTETTLLEVVSDIYSSIDQHQGMILMLLDLHATFDTVNYDILVGQLARRLGIKGVVLQWLNSYLRTRTQTVTIMDAISVLAELFLGVPEGSVSRPLLFVLYVFPLSDIARQHGVSIHSYGDDTQLYISFYHRDLSSISKAVKTLECCIDDIGIWMLRNWRHHVTAPSCRFNIQQGR
jgi:hypothetical protein